MHNTKERKHNEYMAHRQKTDTVCQTCSKPILKGYKRCRSCLMKERWASGNMRSCPSGANHPSWKGGRHHTVNGYIRVLMKEHPRSGKGGYVLEHIIVWEKFNNKTLPKDWIIHHLNGITDDNRPQNLQALPNKKHYLLIQAKAKRIQELEALLNGQIQLI